MGNYARRPSQFRSKVGDRAAHTVWSHAMESGHICVVDRLCQRCAVARMTADARSTRHRVADHIRSCSTEDVTGTCGHACIPRREWFISDSTGDDHCPRVSFLCDLHGQTTQISTAPSREPHVRVESSSRLGSSAAAVCRGGLHQGTLAHRGGVGHLPASLPPKRTTTAGLGAALASRRWWITWARRSEVSQTEGICVPRH